MCRITNIECLGIGTYSGFKDIMVIGKDAIPWSWSFREIIFEICLNSWGKIWWREK